MDNSYTNSNLFLNICHPNLAQGQKIDLIYASENLSLFFSVLNYLPLVVETTSHSDANGSYNCSFVDFDISSNYALYPGYLYPVIVPVGVNYNNRQPFFEEATLLPKINQILQGSYEIGIRVIGPPKKYIIRPVDVFDNNNLSISRWSNSLLVSLLNVSNNTLIEGKIGPSGSIIHTQTLKGDDKVYVNGILSLEIQIYDPCSPLTESGYYIMNDTGNPADTQNLNETCIIIENMTDIVINFGEESIDGDDNKTSGSMIDDKCAIIVRDSANVTFESLKVYQYYYGICVENSSVTVFGTTDSFNLHGAIIDANSEIHFVNTSFSNNNSEILVLNNSDLRLTDVRFELEAQPDRTVYLDSESTDVLFRSVLNPPALPIIPWENKTLMDIGQFIQLTNMSNDSYATLEFSYTEYSRSNITPKAAMDNMHIFKYNGTYNSSSTNQSGNETPNDWSGGNWTKLFTYIDPENMNILLASQINNFSIFAPLGYETNNTQDEPIPEDPDPQPRPKPKGGGDSGGGGTPMSPEEADSMQAYLDSLILDFQIPHNITLMQGAAGEIEFNLTNIGESNAINLLISPDVQVGWEYTNYSLPRLNSKESVTETFQIAPYEKTIPGTYFVGVSVYAYYEGEYYEIVTKMLKVFVKPRGDLERLRILEYPPDVVASPFSDMDISFLVQNIGDINLKNVTIKLEDSPCVLDIQGSHDIVSGEIKSFVYRFSFGDENECNYNLKFHNANDKLVGFLPIKFIVKPTSWLDEPVKASILIIILIVWTTITAYVISRKRRIK